MVREPFGTIGGGGNGGFQSVNLAVQLGAKKIILLGFDMHGTHFHGDHSGGLRNPGEALFKTWRDCFDRAAPVLKSWGVDVINATPGSALECFQKMELCEALHGS